MYEAELDSLQSILRNVVRLYAEIREKYEQISVRESKAEAQIAAQAQFAAPHDATPVEGCFEAADLRLVASRDHLEALERLLQYPPSAYAPAAVARASLECSARTWWLLDPALDVRGRVVRGLIERLISDQEGTRYPSTRLRRKAELGLQSAHEDADALHLGVRIDRRGRVLAVDTTDVPTYSGLIRDQLGEMGEWVYPVLSAITHGVLGGLYSRSAAMKDAGGRYDLDVPNAFVESLIPSVGTTVLGFSKAFNRYIQLFGWDRTDWEALETEAMRLVLRLLEGFEARASVFRHEDSPY